MSESQYDDQVSAARAVPEVDARDLESAQVGEDQQPDLSAAAPVAAEHTGNPVVDSVLDSLEELDRLPPAEHVAVFEAAHERLRGALTDSGEPPTES